jgi:hypothetical protein
MGGAGGATAATGGIGGNASGGSGSGGRGGTGGTAASSAGGGQGGATSSTGGRGGAGNPGVAGAAASAGRSGTPASAGAGSEPPLTPAEDRAPLTGPSERDQKPVLVGSAYIVDDFAVRCVGIAEDGAILMFGFDAAGVSVLAKYADDLSPAWKQSPVVPTSDDDIFARASVGAVAFTAQGETVLTGGTVLPFPGETQRSTRDAFLLKVNADGQAAWAHQWGCDPDGLATAIALGPDGDIVTGGWCGGVLEGSLGDHAGGSFVGRFHGDGSQAFLEQYPLIGGDTISGGRGPNAIVVDPTGVAYLGYEPGAYLRAIDPTGALVQDRRVGDGTRFLYTLGDAPESGPEPSRVSFASDWTSIYNLGVLDAGQMTVDGAIQNLTPDGALRWSRGVATQRDPFDSDTVRWQGRFYALVSLTVTADSLYVAGTYENSYEPASNTPPQPRAAFVGRYDLEGEQIWFQELTLDEAPIAEGYVYDPLIAGVVVRSDESLLLVLSGFGMPPGSDVSRGDATTYAVPLSTLDGSLL